MAVTAQDVQDLFLAMEAVDWSKEAELATIQNDAAYLGFDPVHIATLVLTRLKAQNRPNPASDIKLLIILAVERGNNWNKIRTSLSQDGLTRFDPIATAVGLASSVSGNRRDAVTLARIAMSFPKATVNYMAHCRRPAVLPASMASQYAHYPARMCHPAFAAFIPNSPQPVYSGMMKIFYLFSWKFHTTINKGPSHQSQAAKEQMIGYVKNGVASNLISQAARIQFCITIGMVNNAGDALTANANAIIAAGQAEMASVLLLLEN